MKYKKIVLFTIIVMFLVVYSLSTISATDQNINNSSTISSGINSTGDGDTLTLQEGIYNKSGDYGITIDKNITIQGNASTNQVIIDARKQNRIFTIGNNLNVTFINLTFTNGNSVSGGAIYNQNTGTLLTFINCTFNNNTGTGSGGGGAVYNTGANMSITSSNFTNNTAFRGGAVYNTGANMTINNSNFTNNTFNSIGGAVYNTGANMSITSSNFTNNTVTSTGGAVTNTGANMTINNSNFINNTAGVGGAVHNNGRTMSITSSNFINNKALEYGSVVYNGNGGVTVSITSSSFTNNTANTGGAVVNQGGNIAIINSSFTNNTANIGGAVSNGGGTVSITNSSFTNNNATRGGAVQNIGTMSITSSSFTNNNATNGGAVSSESGTVSITSSNFTNNNATNGGAVSSESGTVSITSSSFTNNTANIGGAVYNYGTMNITSSSFTNNNATNGGAVSSEGGTVSITSSNFTNNTGTGSSGGAVYNTGANMTINNSNFTNNTATSTGGAVFNGGTVSITSSSFTNNTANIGGAVYNGGTMSITSSSFTNNTAGARGGAVYNYGTMNITSSNFTNNKAATSNGGYGGAVANGGGTMNISDSSFTNNSLIISLTSSLGGGAVFNDGTMNITSSNFTNNTVGTRGGAVYNYGTMNITSSNFTNNKAAREGGAVYNTGANMNITNSNFTNNTATSTGGAVYNTGANMNITNSNFTNNNATATNGNGGAVYNTGANMSITSSNFTNNTAFRGGAVYNTGANMTINNSNFTNNTANYGGGVFTSGINSVIVDSNFTGNSHAVGLATTNFTLSGNRIVNNAVGIQFILNNLNYNISGLNNTNTITDNLYAVAISGNNTNYAVRDSFGYNDNGGFIFTNGANGNRLTGNFTGYTRPSDSDGGVAIFFNASSINNEVYNSTISNSDFGVIFNGTNNNLTGSTILNNLEGIVVLNVAGNRINYNRILNNTNKTGFDMVNLETTTDASLNWWGNNTPAVESVNDLGSWFVMELSADIFKTIVNDTYNRTIGNVNLSYQFVLYNNVSKTTSSSSYGDLPYFIVNITWKDNTNTTINSTTGDARNSYSDSVQLNYTNGFSIEAIGDNKDIILYLGPDINGTVNLTVTKTANVTGVVINGQEVTYTITVTNNGPANATNVIVYEDLSGNFILVSADTNNVGLYDNATGIWAIGNLDLGETATMILTVRVNATTNGNRVNLTNNITVTTDDDNLGDDTANATITIDPGVNLTVTKTVNVTGNVVNGQTISYNITVTNNGPNNATNVKVNELLPSALVYLNHTASLNYNPSTGVWNIGNLANGDSISLIIVVRVNGTGNIGNSVNVTSTEENINNETNGTNITENITVVPGVNLTVTKTVNVTGNIVNGQTISYNITVTNNGPNNATNVKVNELLPSALVYLNHTIGANYDPSTGVWNIGNLANGDSISLIIVVRVNGTGNIGNSVNVTSTEENINNETNGTNITENITVVPGVNLTVTKTVNVTGNVVNGQTISYNITVTNNGPNNATNVKVNELLPSALVYLNHTAGAGTYDPNTGVWNIGNLNNGNSISLIITVHVNGTGNIGNSINVTSNEENINNETNNTNITKNITVVGAVNLTVTKVVNVTGTVTNGQTINYNITVTNNGPDNATNVIVNEVLPSALIYINHTAGVGSYDPSTGVWNIGNLNNGNSISLIITVRINGTGTISNGVNVTSNEENINNETNDTNIAENITVVKGNVVIDINVPDAYIGDTVNVVVKLTDQFGNVLAHTTVIVVIDGKSMTLTSDKNGNIVIPTLVTKKTTLGTVSFQGNDNYNSAVANDSGVNKKHYIIVTFEVIEHKDGSITITAKAIDDLGKPVKDYPISFYLDGKLMGSDKTNNKGITTLYIPTNKISDGKHLITVVAISNNKYDGDSASDNYVKNTTENPSDNSTTKTNGLVVMKKTGIPIISVLILLLISAFGIYRRKDKK
ncbi:large cysteine-rich periplasmic protein OmcB precursor [Methanobrevibacter cuticularis]|uniref:Large cysteine-rich periplasmic protein OmcB n=1 Tax=Methanobrevibacter cuticularis TaxID=47311 RepID=A0A166F742_9EURY|nr:DUF11 domain-containing protein [Methanobrevibacter cuticularis]KZX17383.1 large cysteine-rich periplasmic protein OmcB precursor [Methanobrevibacter cuticularis]